MLKNQNNKTLLTTKEISMVKGKKIPHIVTFITRILAQNLLRSYTPKVNMRGNIFTIVNFVNMRQIQNSSSNPILKGLAQKNNKRWTKHTSAQIVVRDSSLRLYLRSI